MNKMKTPAILKRKKMGVTDYRKRLSLLRSESTRLIIRPTGKGIVVQVADFAQEGDIILATVNANILKKTLGISGNNSQISYISGYYLGMKALSKGVEYAVVDTGRFKLTRGGRISCAIKGAVDAGLEINVSEEIFPPKDRIQGKHLKNPVDVEAIKKSIKEKVK